MVLSDSGRSAFAVVTDSTADIEPVTASELAVGVVPLCVTGGEDTYPDGQLTQMQFFALMKAAAKLPTTSQPAVGSFLDAYERALEHAEHVISVHISEKLSGTVEGARQAADRFGNRVSVFDSRNLSWGLAWQVADAAPAAREGLTVAAALERLGRVRERVGLIVGLDGLDNLARGGRIGHVGAFPGSLLNLKVTFTVGSDGAFEPLGRSRGDKAAMKYTLDWVAERMGSAECGRFAIGHALSRDRAEWLRDRIAERWGVSQMVIYEAGSVIATHTGTGWGVAVLPDE